MPSTSPDRALAAYWAIVEAEAARARAAPLSLRHAMLCGVLIANLPDHVFAAHRDRSDTRAARFDDALAFRAHVREVCPLLRRFEALADPATAGALHRVMTPVPPDGTQALHFADFMVCLYNGDAVPTVLLADADGGAAIPFADAMREALAWWSNEIEAAEAARLRTPQG